jgi:DNA-binding NarL/FixJ family response regulator
MIKVVVAHKDPIVRAGISSILRASGHVWVSADSGDGHQTIEAIRRHQPDVAILDVQIDGVDGIRVTELTRRHIPSTQVVIHTAIATEDCVYRCFTAGAAGFVLKGAAPQDLIKAVLAVAAGDTVLCPSVARYAVTRFLQVDHARATAAQRQIATLTVRERDVLERLTKGMGNTEIAAELSVSEGTVKAHVSHLLAKLGCTNRVQAALLACDSGLFAHNEGAAVRSATSRARRPSLPTVHMEAAS